jgi:hypothetical protein
LSARLDKTALSEKMIEEDLSRVEESTTKSTYRLGVEFERYEKKSEKSAPKFVTSSSYHKEEETLKPTKAHYPSNPKPSFNPKREARKKPPSQERKLLFACFVALLVTWMSFASGGRELRGGVLSMQAARSRHVSHAVFILLSILWHNQQTIAHLILRHKLRNRCDDFMGQITKPELPILRLKPKNPSE